jgi:hypothetical protein
MSQTLYLVRLRSVFRVREIYDVRVDRLPAEALFSTREAAEGYIKTYLPLAHNPFARTSGSLSVSVDGNFLTTYEENAENSPAVYYCDWNRFRERLQRAGIESPEECMLNPALWWDDVRARETPEQVAHLRELLEIPDWGDNPFEVADVYPYERLEFSYFVPMIRLMILIRQLGLETPKIAEPLPESWQSLWGAESRLVSWWDETAPRMTDEQKAALWRLLDPQPWEIVEVEFEGKL